MTNVAANDIGAWSRVNPDRLREYWYMLVRREQMRQARLRGEAPPWTEDPILRAHRFTNVFRASDRVSQYLIQRVQYTGSQTPSEVVFRTLLFKLFNQIETWQYLCSVLDQQPSLRNWDPEYYTALLNCAQDAGVKLWNNAYMITPPPDCYGGSKHKGWLYRLEQMRAAGTFDFIPAAPGLKAIYERLLSYETVGAFFAMQWTIDLNYSRAVNWDENTFIVPGPGAVRGGTKLAPGVDTTRLIHLLERAQEEDIPTICQWEGVNPIWLGGLRRLHLIDIQSGLCEYDKWCRVAHPELNPGKLYARIKQTYDASTASRRPLPTPWFPPKWGLNDRELPSASEWGVTEVENASR